MQLLTENQQELISFPFVRESLYSEHTKANPEFDVIVKPSDKKILGMLPHSQFILPHTVAYQKVEDALNEAGLKASISEFKLLRNGARFFTHFRLPDKQIEVGGAGDVMYPEIILRNAYDGDFPFGLEWGLWRQICTNGARAIFFAEKATKKSLMGDTDIAVMVSQIRDFLGNGLQSLFNRIALMKETRNESLAESTSEWLAPQLSNKMQEIFTGILSEHQEPLTEWDAFNAVTNLVTHNVGSYNRRRALELAAARHFEFEGYAKD